MGRVRLKSKRAAFSIASAREGGAKASELAPNMESDLRDRTWGFEIENLTLGSGIWRMGILGVGERELVETGIKHLEEAIIMLAIVTAL